MRRTHQALFSLFLTLCVAVLLAACSDTLISPGGDLDPTLNPNIEKSSSDISVLTQSELDTLDLGDPTTSSTAFCESGRQAPFTYYACYETQPTTVRGAPFKLVVITDVIIRDAASTASSVSINAQTRDRGAGQIIQNEFVQDNASPVADTLRIEPRYGALYPQNRTVDFGHAARFKGTAPGTNLDATLNVRFSY